MNRSFQQNQTKNNKGFILVFILLLIPIFITLSISFLTMAGSEYSFAGQTAKKIQAQYLAGSGITYAYYNWPSWDMPATGDNAVMIELDTGKVQIEAEKYGTDKIKITSTGGRGFTRTKVIAVINCYGKILSWQEDSSWGEDNKNQDKWW